MNISEKYKSPNYTKGPRKVAVDTIVIHYISAINIDKDDPFNVEKVLDLLIKPIPTSTGSVKVSAHFAIDRDGNVYNLVGMNDVAWHAGKSQMPDGKSYRNSCNEFSIGIELFGGKWIDFTDAQYDALVELTKYIKFSWNNDIDWKIVGHDTIAPGRKVDPGPRFDWYRYLKALKKSEKGDDITKQEDTQVGLQAAANHSQAEKSEEKFEGEYLKKYKPREPDVELKDPQHRKENNITNGKEGCWLFRLFRK